MSTQANPWASGKTLMCSPMSMSAHGRDCHQLGVVGEAVFSKVQFQTDRGGESMSYTYTHIYT